jgi:hypothetical protein
MKLAERKLKLQMKLFQIILTAACILMQLIAAAQAKVTITAPDSLSFIGTWNNAPLNQMPVNSISFRTDQLSKIPVQLTFPNQPSIQIMQTVNLKDQTAVSFELNKVKGAYKLVPASENTYVFPKNSVATAIVIESQPLLVDTMSIAATHIDQADYEFLKTQIASHTFEVRKLEVMGQYLQDHAINIDQLRFLMAQLSLEDRKLELLRLAVPKMTEKSRMMEVTEEFLLDKNKAKAREIVGQ